MISIGSSNSFMFLVQTFSVILYILPIVLSTNKQNKDLSPKEIEDKLKDEYIIPDVIYTVPKHRMEVRFEEGDKVYDVNYGTFLTPRQAMQEPKVEWPVEKDTLYSLLCVSPDVPTREEPTLRDWVQWLTVNINGSNVSTGDTVNHWQGPGPNERPGDHRYVFVVFKENPHLEVHINRSDTSQEMRMWMKRMNFNTDHFIRYFNLGDPWASNFFMSRFDHV